MTQTADSIDNWHDCFFVRTNTFKITCPHSCIWFTKSLNRQPSENVMPRRIATSLSKDIRRSATILEKNSTHKTTSQVACRQLLHNSYSSSESTWSRITSVSTKLTTLAHKNTWALLLDKEGLDHLILKSYSRSVPTRNKTRTHEHGILGTFHQ